MRTESRKETDTMKKLIAVLLLGVCLFSLFSCGNKELKEYSEAFLNCEASAAHATVEVTISEDQVLTYTSDFYYDPDTKKGEANALVIQHFSPLTFDNNNNAVIPKTPTAEMTAQLLSDDAEVISLKQLNFNKKYFKNKEYTIDAKGSFQAVVTNPTAFFGTDIGASEVEVTITNKRGAPDKATLIYTSQMGFDVKIVVEYEY